MHTLKPNLKRLVCHLPRKNYAHAHTFWLNNPIAQNLFCFCKWKKIGENCVDFYAHSNCRLSCFVNAIKFPFTHKFLEKMWLGKNTFAKNLNKQSVDIYFVCGFSKCFSHVFNLNSGPKWNIRRRRRCCCCCCWFCSQCIKFVEFICHKRHHNDDTFSSVVCTAFNSTGHNKSNVNRHSLWVLTFVYTNFVHSKSPTKMRAHTQYCRMAAHNLIKKNPLGNRGSSWNIQMNWMHIITMHNAVCGFIWENRKFVSSTKQFLFVQLHFVYVWIEPAAPFLYKTVHLCCHFTKS